MASVLPRARRALLPLSALVLVLAGCGTDSDQPALSGDPTTSTTEAPPELTTTTEAPEGVGCSAAGEPEADTAGSVDLPEPVAELRLEIVEAARACDYATLEELAVVVERLRWRPVLSARAGAGRCAYCHDDLDEASTTCPGCATRLHADCRDEAGCPTPGCGFLRGPRPRDTAAPLAVPRPAP